jgi:hypothetical protein
LDGFSVARPENNCVDDPVKLCDFQLLENRIMKTVDSVYQVSTLFLSRLLDYTCIAYNICRWVFITSFLVQQVKYVPTIYLVA